MSNVVARIIVPCFLALGWFNPDLSAQSNTLTLKLSPEDQATFWENIPGFKPAPREKKGETAHFLLADSISTDTVRLRLLQHFRNQSYLLVSLDSVQTDSGAAEVLYIGPTLRWVNLRLDTVFAQETWLRAIASRTRAQAGKPFHYRSLQKLEQSILEAAENNGYPFAEVWLDSVVVASDGAVSATMRLDKKSFFVFRGIKTVGDLKLPKSFLINYLGIKSGTPYSRARVLGVRGQLRSLLFVEATSNPTLTFARNTDSNRGEATLNLFLQKKRASRFDFIIGLLPQPDAADGKLLLTGSLSAAFQNALNLGERFSAELERLRPETQKINIQTSIPYLLGTSFGAEGRLNIFKRDSTWTDAQGDVGVSYWFEGENFVRFFWENKSSFLQKVDTQAVLISRQLPATLDYRQNGFGLETAFSRLDYRFNPRRGWFLSLKAVAGFNQVQRNSQIENLRDAVDPAFAFSSLYDSVAGRAARYRGEFRGEVFVPLMLRSTIKIAVRGGGIFSKKPVFANEQYRLGGNKLLRGFDEESLFATRFVVATAEWRLLLGQNSFLSAFADWSYLENLTLRNRLFLRPLGVGAGLNFETKAGIFGISAAVGRRDVGQSVDFRATKFHLGYVSLF